MWGQRKMLAGSAMMVRRGGGWKAWRPRTRIWIGLAVTLIVLASSAVAVHVVLPAHALPRATAEYGASDAAVQTATDNAGWPQQANNWCGIAAIAATAQFVSKSVTQSNVANYLQTQASESEWGTPPQVGGVPPFVADIAADGGTDPRAMAAGLVNATGQSYHQWVGFFGAYDATMHLIQDVVRTQQPVTAVVLHGLHLVLVSAVYATDNPATNPSSVTSLVIWDPGYGSPYGSVQGARMVVVPINTWLTSPNYWGQPYSPNFFGSIPYDPDPSVGPYTYDPAHGANAHLWIGQFVYLHPDTTSDPSNGINLDWPFTVNGALIVGVNGGLPQGYTGPKYPLLNKTILNELSIDEPALWTESAYSAVSVNGFTPAAALAWTGTDGAHHLNVSLSADGLTYVNKLTLPETSFARPSVTVVPVNGKNIVVMAWVGTDGAHTLNVVYDVYGAYRKATFWGETTPYAPSIVWFNQQIWLAWAGTDGNHTLNVMPLGPQGLVHGAKKTLWGQGAASGPLLVDDANGTPSLIMTWQHYGSGGPWFNLMQSSDGANWTTPLASPPQQTTIDTPGFTAVSSASPNASGMDAYYWMWSQQSGPHLISYMQTSSLGTWPAQPVTFTETSGFGPVLGYLGNAHQIAMMWTGTDSAHHLNIATFAV